MSIQKILIIDDDSLSRAYLKDAIASLGYKADAVSSGTEGIELVKSRDYDLVLTDLRMPSMDGTEVIRNLREKAPDLPVVLVTAHGSIESAVKTMRLGASDFLVKPCTAEAIQLVIKRIERTSRLERENEYLRREFTASGPVDVIAESPKMKEILAAGARIATSKGTVLITGESGTGKERLAHFIHQKSPRRDGAFIRVNCAALSEQLLESELFGHERGSFTGAHRRREGRFELADGGTLLLDEIGEISPALQSKLLRVLEEEEFERVGGSTTLKVDVRVIATTNRDLPRAVKEGNFREDLYYRLHVLPLEIASLRNRHEDISPLANHFADYYARQNGFAVPDFSDEARQRLEAWHWPGNVRELENVVQRAVVLLEGSTVEARHLLFGPTAGGALGPHSLVGASGSRPQELDLRKVLANRAIADIERDAILGTLDSTGGNKTEAARRLGVTARTVSNKMKLWKQMGLVA